MARALFTNAESTALENEQMADLYGIETAARADFDVSRTVEYWENIARAYPDLIFPGPSRRQLTIGDLVEQLASLMPGTAHYDLSSRLARIQRYALRFASPATDRPPAS